MRIPVRYIICFFLLGILPAVEGMAQRVSFGLYASDGIQLIPGSVEELSFNNKQHIILRGNTVNISLTDNATAILAITARADLDVTITVDADPYLFLDAVNKIPMSVSFAYSNLGAGNEVIARTQAIQVPAGFNTITIPMFRRTTGPPGPPPAPGNSGEVFPTITAYLFFYGILGPVPNDAAAGHYDGEINVHAEYATYE